MATGEAHHHPFPPERAEFRSHQQVLAPYFFVFAEVFDAAFVSDGAVVELPGNASIDVDVDDRFEIETPGGGGFGRPG